MATAKGRFEFLASGHALDVVLRAQEVEHLRIKDLPGELPGLLEDRAAVLGVGEAVEVGASSTKRRPSALTRMPSGSLSFSNWSRMASSPNSGAFRSQPQAWQPDQSPNGLAPISRAMRRPSPVLKRVPRSTSRRASWISSPARAVP